MRKQIHCLPGIILLVAALSGIAYGASDFQWTLDVSGTSAYVLTTVSSPKVYAETLPANNPTINLILGQRYGVTNLNPAAHPFQIIAAGGTGDVVLLSEGSVVGSLEGDAGIAWIDSGTGTIEFTVTQSLVNAFAAGGGSAGYRSQNQIATIRGAFALFGTGTKITDPIAARIPKGSLAVGLEPVIGGLVSPLGLLEPNDGSKRLFVYDQIGKIWILKDGIPLSTPFLDVSASLVGLNINYDERGLLGFAFHPNFASNRKFYTYTSQPVQGVADFTVAMTGSPNHQAVISEWMAQAGQPDLADPASQRVLLRIDQPQFNHNGGALRFGLDGYLYMTMGDGGAGDDQGDGHVAGGNGQSIQNVYGKILRIDVNGSNSTNGRYGIPSDNPLVGVPGVDEIYAYGLRNPFSMSFDSLTHRLYVADAGQNNIEEVDLIVKGGNYGWPLKEGSFFFDPNGSGPGFVTTVPVTPLPAGLVDPIAEYDHDDGSVIVGGFVYRGSSLPSLTGFYVAGDFGTSFSNPSGRLFYVNISSGLIQEFQIDSTDSSLGLWLKGFGQDLGGEIYVCGSERLGPDGATGRVIKLIPPRLFLPLIKKDLTP